MSVPHKDIEHFPQLLRATLDKKLNFYLEQLERSFSKFHQVAAKMVALLVELDDCMEQLKQPKCQVQINNSLYYLNLFFSEFPAFLAWSYCESFTAVAHERITLIRANLHPIFHIMEELRPKKHIYDLMVLIEEKCTQLIQAVSAISNEISLNQAVLKQKEDVQKKYTERIDYIINQRYKLNEDLDFLRFYNLFQQLRKMAQSPPLDELFKSINNLAIVFSKIITVLELPIEYAKQVKQQGKRNIKGNAHEIQFIMRYTQILASKEQIYLNINRQNYDDCYEYNNLVEKLPFITRPTHAFVMQFNLNDLRNYVQQKEVLMTQMTQTAKRAEVISEWTQRSILQQITLSQLMEAIPQMIAHLSTFLRNCQFFQATQEDLRDFFKQNFQTTIEIEFPEFEQVTVL